MATSVRDACTFASISTSRVSPGWKRSVNSSSVPTTLSFPHGGSISGEHGDGQARAIFLGKMYGENLVRAFERFKWLWDPDNRMNPGKVVHPRRPDQDLRIRPGYADKAVETHFAYRGDDGSFARATARCAGVGACRRTSGGTMCPSYMVTRDEEHSTRGRARLLFEMMAGDVIADGWRNEHVKESLDLCLACKGCKSECPVNVDMATYKAEFLSHYYAGRLRPRMAYAVGWIYWWARAASPIAPLVNFFTSTPPFSAIIKMIGGIAQQRTIPRFASPTFRSWFQNRKPGVAGTRRVILWPDTFSNYLHPSGAIAAIEVLEHAGFHVDLPKIARSAAAAAPRLRGMLDIAKGSGDKTLDTLRDDIRARVPIIGLEPSCVAAFRDELLGLFPDDEDAQRLARQTFMLSEFLVNEGYQPGSLDRRAVVHGHCHHKAVIGMSAEEEMLRRPPGSTTRSSTPAAAHGRLLRSAQV